MKRFEVGKVYEMRSACDYDCVWVYEVVERTASTVTLVDPVTSEIKKCRIAKDISEQDGREAVRPLGRYSMSPILRA